MNLPIRIPKSAPSSPVITVDGTWDAPGLNLSHWPGNRTPPHLRRDLSTGCALAFAELEPLEREQLAEGCTAIVNNHVDTDGLCALFAVRHPKRAGAYAQALLEAAAAGDFFEIPTERALCVDLLVSGVYDQERSPLRAESGWSDSQTRYELGTHYLIDRAADLFDSERLPHPELWRDGLNQALDDLKRLRQCKAEAHPDMDLHLWSETADNASPGPGRHALFDSTSHDLAAWIECASKGSRYRLIQSTRSWFDLPSRAPVIRKDMRQLAQSLNHLEGSDEGDEQAWRAQAPTNASPELWFGTRDPDAYVEHGEHLRASSLRPEQWMAELKRFLL